MPEDETPQPESLPEPPVVDPGEIGTTEAVRGVRPTEVVRIVDPGEIDTVTATKSDQAKRLKQADGDNKTK